MFRDQKDEQVWLGDLIDEEWKDRDSVLSLVAAGWCVMARVRSEKRLGKEQRRRLIHMVRVVTGCAHAR